MILTVFGQLVSVMSRSYEIGQAAERVCVLLRRCVCDVWFASPLSQKINCEQKRSDIYV
jgi:hypothetical protein